MTSSDERYTPKWVVNLIHKVLGEIDLDPTNNHRNSTLAKHRFSEDNSCLTSYYWGAGLQKLDTVYMNPPFSNSHVFLNKFIEQQKFYLFDGITCTLSGALHNKRTQHLFTHAKAICIWYGRLEFEFPEEIKRNGNDRDVIFAFFGECVTKASRDRLNRFITIFSDHGLIVKPEAFGVEK